MSAPDDAPGAPDAPDGDDARVNPLARERELLVEALTAAFAATTRAGAGEGPDPARDEPDEPADAPTSGESDDARAAVGCAWCGCGSPRACAVCPICRGAAAALDPYLLERVADVAVLLADGLRAAARRLAAMDESAAKRATGSDDERSGT